jgi:hypothetical protein
MPSKRPQLNVRLSDEDLALIETLRGAAGAALGLSLSKSDVLRMALAELARRYAPGAAGRHRPRRRGKSGKGGT